MTDPAPVADEAPNSNSLTATAYDQAHLTTYLRLLDAAAANADWHEVTAIVLQRNPDAKPTRRCWETHFQRIQWMVEHGYKELIRASTPLMIQGEAYRTA